MSDFQISGYLLKMRTGDFGAFASKTYALMRARLFHEIKFHRILFLFLFYFFKNDYQMISYLVFTKVM